MLMSVGSRTSSIPVIELTVVPPSLIASLAMCECASMMPGDTNWPVVSMTSAPGGTATLAPTAAILPSRRITVPFGIVPFVTVSTVPPRSATIEPAGRLASGLPGFIDPGCGEGSQNEQGSGSQKDTLAADHMNLQ